MGEGGEVTGHGEPVEPRAGGVKVEYRPIKELKGYKRNPKKHDMVGLLTSLDKFGYVNPIIVNGRTGELLAGHGRVKALEERKKMGLPAPERVAVRDDGEWLVPVVVVCLDEGKHGAYLLADNRLVETGGWDDDLPDVVRELGKSGDLDWLKFDVKSAQDVVKERDEEGAEVPGMELRPYEHWDYIVLLFKDQRDWLKAVRVFDIRERRFPGKRQLGIGRVIDGAKALKIIEGHKVEEQE